MKKLVAITSLWCCGIFAAEPSIRRLDGSRIPVQEAEDFARRTLAEAHVTGAQIAVIDRGKLVWSAAFGLRRREPRLPMDQQTTTWAASITKGVFASYVMQLVERRVLSLDTPVAQLLQRPLTAYDPYKETATAIVHDPNWLKVTPRHLLSHTSGLYNFVFLEPDKKLRLHFVPGTQYGYSGEGMNLLQFAIEQKMGKGLDGLMQDAFFTPLAMTRTGLIYRTGFAGNVADRYGESEAFLSRTTRFPARAAGSMTTSAEDLARFLIALMGGRILKPAAKKAMLSPVISIKTLHQFEARADAAEGTEGPAAGLAYGIGWGLLTRTKFGPAFFKEGHGDGAQNYAICFEKRRACMIILTNSDNGELTFRPLMEKIFGNTVTPWEWECYTPSCIGARRKSQ